MSNHTTITPELAEKIQRIAGAEINVGDVYRWENGPLTVVVKSVNLNEERDGFAGLALAPYAWVQWSDDEKESTINIAGIGSYLRSGAFTKVEAA